MNLRNALDKPDGQRGPEDLDGLLRAYFRAETPDPWPAWQRPREVTPLPSRNSTRTLARGRWALAASLVGLVMGTLYLSGRFADTGTSVEPAGRKTDAARRLTPFRPHRLPVEPRHDRDLAPLDEDDDLFR